MDRQVRRRARELQTKRCPRCGQVLFSDMSVCYGCLYNFEKHEEENTCGMLVPDDWDAGLPPYELSEGERSEVLNGAAYAYGLKIRDATLEVVAPLPAAGVIVGRGEGCDIILRAPAVSRQHVRIEPEGARVLVTDLGATNHARLEGVEVVDAVFMDVGSTLDVCGVLLTLTRW